MIGFRRNPAARAFAAAQVRRAPVRTLQTVALLSFWLCVTPRHPESLWGSMQSAKPGQAKQSKETIVLGSLTLVNESGTVTVLSAKEFAKLPRQSLKAKDHSGAPAEYEGVTLAEVLQTAKVALGKDLKGPLLANCLLVEAADGYRVTFALPEVDPSMTDNLVLLADRKDGKPLDAKEAPYRLVVPQDKKYSRWVRQVTRISVRTTTEIVARTREK